jgi:hypothetical protein
MSGTGQPQELLQKTVRACVTGDVGLCEDVFTRDVTCVTPVLTATSRDDLETQLSRRAGSLSDIEIVVDRAVEHEGVLVGEWTIRAVRTGAFSVSGAMDVEGIGQVIELTGATVAEVTGRRVSSVHNYFDPAPLAPRSGP